MLVRKTVTSLNCQPGSIALGETSTCTAEVKDASGGPVSGAVSFESSNEAGQLEPSICTLVDLGEISACAVTFSPKATGVFPITASYQGDADQPGQATVSVSDTKTSLTCQPESLALGEASTCTAEVKNTGAGPDSVSGSVSFKTDHKGRFEPSSCSLDERNACTVKYFPEAIEPVEGGESHLITASYEGDANHLASSASEAVTVGTVSVGLTCEAPDQGEFGSCVVRVVSESRSRGLTGTVKLTSSLPGQFSPSVCTLAPFLNNDGAFCSMTYFPIVAGVHELTALYSGDPTHPRAIGRLQINVADG